MSRRMSVSLTLDAVRERRKTVTRRHVDTWRTLKAGDRLTLIEKGMGLAKGEKQTVVTEVEVTDVRVEPLGAVDEHELALEGFPGDRPATWRMWWAGEHGYSIPTMTVDEVMAWIDTIECRRIEWRYLDEEATP